VHRNRKFLQQVNLSLEFVTKQTAFSFTFAVYPFSLHRLMWYFLKADFGVDDEVDSTRRLYTPIRPETNSERSNTAVMQAAVAAATTELPHVLKKLDEVVRELAALRGEMKNEIAELKHQQLALGCPISAERMCWPKEKRGNMPRRDDSGSGSVGGE
jgi:hypothetical protein